MTNKKRIKLLISGRVQGVGFRANTKRKAKKLDLNGWVKNLPNGKVKAIVEGEKAKIDKFIKWAKKGPFLAKVSNIEKEEEEIKEEFKKFKIKYD